MLKQNRLVHKVQPELDEQILLVAQYLTELIRQLEAVARASKLELLAYLLSMAQAEARTVALEARTPTPTAQG